MKRIIYPIHLHSESELEAIQAHYEQTNDAAGVALVAPELARRREDTRKLEKRQNPNKKR